jgi:NADPH:quinone reductase-like Zn-dependent oxidoreductase
LNPRSKGRFLSDSQYCIINKARYGTHPIPYPNILGGSYAGTVEAVGANVTNFQAGDRVVVLRPGAAIADPRFGAYQRFPLAVATHTAKLPSSVSFEAAAAVITNLSAVSAALTIFGGLDKPTLSANVHPPKQDKKVLIYGGSSSTGGLAIRYARGAGYEVVTTSSPRHREYVESLEPSVVIDHSAPAEAIETAIRANGPYDFILDTIGLPPVTDLLVSYVDTLGGGSYNTMIPPIGGEKPIPERVQRKFEPYNFAFEKPGNEDLKRWLFEELVPQGLESGVIVPTRGQWVEGGLKSVQKALDLMGDNKVSGSKLLVDPWA